MNGNDYSDNCVVTIMLVLWGWMSVLMLMGVGRSLSSVGGTFSCGFESIGCNVYFDMIKLLLPFLIFEFEVVMLLVGIIGGYSLVIGVIVSVMVVELLNQGFSV